MQALLVSMFVLKSAKKIIEKEGIDLTYYSIIYELIDDAKQN
ncbi:MAG: hypothetical protein Ct9H90mP6_04360 [Gammaproteobacteria bacterium]|nr:MAG: hypothetical protein Ct9H90mP6_04360 [Gammaproteobacteria bacterium]